MVEEINIIQLLVTVCDIVNITYAFTYSVLDNMLFRAILPHRLGKSSITGICLNVFQHKVFSIKVDLLQQLIFIFFWLDPAWIFTCLLFHFEILVDIMWTPFHPVPIWYASRTWHHLSNAWANSTVAHVPTNASCYRISEHNVAPTSAQVRHRVNTMFLLLLNGSTGIHKCWGGST